MLKNAFKKYSKIFLISALLTTLFAVNPVEQKLANSAQAADNNFTLTWSSGSYIPPGYEGLALPTMGSQIKVFVLPTRKLNFDPERLTYRWLLDNEIVGGAGGQGKTAFSFRATKWPGDSHTVASQILDGENVIWRGSLEIKISSAKAIFKLPNDNYSILETARTKTGQTLQISAIPFFFNTKSLSDLNFQWKLDGQELASSDNKNFDVFLLTVPAGQIEEALLKSLSLLISDKKNSDQQASSQITIEIK